MDLFSVDWTQVPLALAVVAILIARAWKSRELQALRARVEELDEELFEGVRRLNASRRARKMLQDEIEELRGTVADEKEEDVETETVDGRD